MYIFITIFHLMLDYIKKFNGPDVAMSTAVFELLKLQTPQKMISPEVIYRLASNAGWIGFHNKRTRSVCRSLSKYTAYRIVGAIQSLIIPVLKHSLHILWKEVTLDRKPGAERVVCM